MLLTERKIKVPVPSIKDSIIEYFRHFIDDNINQGEIPVRFVITQTDSYNYHCELGVLEGFDNSTFAKPASIFDFKKRKYEAQNEFNAVLIIPTGIGAEIGGHAGDATPVARLLASLCDNLITHPNVVNASDINELPENGLYVEGSVLSRLLMGDITLQKIRSNRVIVVVDKHPDSNISHFSINSISAARSTLGINCPIVVEMEKPIKMQTDYSVSGRAIGRIDGIERLLKILDKYRLDYDAIALTSTIDIEENLLMEYFKSSGDIVNPWGGVEALLTHTVSTLFNVPSAHSPMMESNEILNLDLGIVDPRMSAEAISTSFLYCILKGLHRSPRILSNSSIFPNDGIITASNISCIVIPDGCIGLPTLAALEQGIPVIAVKDNANLMENDLSALPWASNQLHIVNNYLEVVGVMAAIKSGITTDSVKRPFPSTKVVRKSFDQMREEAEQITATSKLSSKAVKV